MKNIFLYGLSGRNEGYKPIRYETIPEDSFSVTALTYEASLMKFNYPSIKEVYAIDPQRELKKDYLNAWKGNIENCIIFRDILVRNGIKII